MRSQLHAQLGAPGALRAWVVGDVMLDRDLVGVVERVAPEAPVPVLRLDPGGASEESRAQARLGGAGHVAHGLVALGATVALGGAVGDDEAGAVLRARAAAAGIHTGGVLCRAERLTTVKQRALAGDRLLLRIDHERTQPLTDADLDRLLDGLAAALPAPDFVIVSDYRKGVVRRALIERLRARLPAVPIAVDAKGGDWTEHAGASLLTPNTDEAARATGIQIRDAATLRQAADRLAAQVPGAAVVITRDRHGMVLRLPDHPDGAPLLHAPACASSVVDVTGAGDAVVAVLALARARGLDWPEALHAASVAAGIAVGRRGAVPVTLAELLGALSGGKQLARQDLPELRRRATARGQKLVLTNGCFDVLHVGHLRVLEAARRAGDVLLVAVNSDDSVRRLKGPGRPVVPAAERAELLAGLRAVDYVTIFEEDTPLEVVRACRPDVLVKGGDYQADAIVGASEVRGWGGRVEIVPLLAARSTTGLLDRAAAAAVFGGPKA